MTQTAPSTGVVLAGAAALGAYEVGVIAHLVESVLPEVGGALPQVFAGTSAGAINAAALAATAEDPATGIRLLARGWSELQLGQILRPSSVELLSMVLDVSGAPVRLRRALRVLAIRGGLLDTTALARIVEQIPLHRIPDHISAGRLQGLALTATRVATGAAVVFYDAHLERPWRVERNLEAIPTRLTADHVLASAALPLLFPAVTIAGEAYCDGGLRQMVPLSPAIHVGVDRLLVINPLPTVTPPRPMPDNPTSPLYLAGKALNALFADRVEADLGRLAQTSAILRAGHRRFGASFEAELNEQLVQDGGTPLRAIDAVTIEPSTDLGILAAAHVTSRSFAARGAAAGVLRLIADGDPQRAGDLLAYVLFDGAFEAELIALGRRDARARHADLCDLVLPSEGQRAGPRPG